MARVEGRTAAIPTDPQACRLAAALVALMTALTAIGVTILGTLP